jgi:hypothetical protein
LYVKLVALSTRRSACDIGEDSERGCMGDDESGNFQWERKVGKMSVRASVRGFKGDEWKSGNFQR